MKYTPEKFISNILEDAEYFGDDLAQGLYEDILSDICGYRISLSGIYEEAELEALALLEDRRFSDLGHNIRGPLPPSIGTKGKSSFPAAPFDPKLSNLDLSDLKRSELLKVAENASKSPAKPFDPKLSNLDLSGLKQSELLKAANAAETAIENGVKLPGMPKVQSFWHNVADGKVPLPDKGAAAGTGLLAKIGAFLKGIPGKIAGLFKGLRDGTTSFGQLFQKGLAWISANPTKALGTAGGTALVFMLIKALRKRGQLGRFQELNRLAQQKAALREDAYDTILGDTAEKRAMRELLEACRTNRRLEKALFGAESRNTVFDY